MDLDDVLTSIFELQNAMFAFAIPLGVDLIYKTYEKFSDFMKSLYVDYFI